MTTTRKMKVADLYRWGYGGNSSISFLTNVIQCQCGNKAAKMQGLFQLVSAGHDVHVAQFDIFKITVNGTTFDVSALETPEVIEAKIAE